MPERRRDFFIIAPRLTHCSALSRGMLSRTLAHDPACSHHSWRPSSAQALGHSSAPGLTHCSAQPNQHLHSTAGVPQLMTGRRFSTIFSNGSGFSSFAAQDHYPFWRTSSNALTLADKPHLTQCVCTRTSVYSAQRPHCAQDPYPVVRVVSSRIQAHRPSATVAPLASHTVAQNPFE